jgi:hypothetical protein
LLPEFDQIEDSKEAKFLKEYAVRLGEMMSLKWDQVSAHILQFIDSFEIEQSENFLFSSHDDNDSIAIWGNLTKSPRFKTAEFTDVQLFTSLPKAISLESCAIRIMFITSIPVLSQYAQDTSDYSILGGILLLDLLELPETAKTVGRWKIRPMNPTFALKRLDYPFKKESTEETKVPPAENQEETRDNLNTQQLNIKFCLPSDSMITRDTCKVMYYDENTKSWSANDISAVEIDEGTREVKFTTLHFRPTALIQLRFAEYPLKSWHLKPMSQDSTCLTMEGKWNRVEIQIHSQGCQLLQPMNAQLEKHFKGKFFPAGVLLRVIFVSNLFRKWLAVD